jgi:hypothetical protein
MVQYELDGDLQNRTQSNSGTQVRTQNPLLQRSLLPCFEMTIEDNQYIYIYIYIYRISESVTVI